MATYKQPELIELPPTRDFKQWIKELSPVRVTDSTWSKGPQNYKWGTNWEHKKREAMLKSSWVHWAKLPINKPACCVRAVALKDILKLHPELTRDNFTYDAKMQYVIIKPDTATTYRLKAEPIDFIDHQN